MKNLITYAREFLTSIGLMRPSSGTPITSLFSTLPGHHRILLSGLDEAGKSTLLRSHLATDEKEISLCIGMIAHQVEVYRCGNVTFQTIDLGGGRPESYFRTERSFFRHCNALVWVDDSADHNRLIEAREELFQAVCHQDGLRNDIPVLILANKQDKSVRGLTFKHNLILRDSIERSYSRADKAILCRWFFVAFSKYATCK